MSELPKLFRELNPFEREARTLVSKHFKSMKLPEPHYYAGQFELKAKVDSLRELEWFAVEYGGEVETEPGSFRDTFTKAFTVIQVEGVKVRVCAYVSDEEAEARGLW